MTDTMTATLTPDECFAKCASALEAGSVEIAREWRQLGEVIRNSKRP